MPTATQPRERIAALQLRSPQDAIACRQLARAIAVRLGFDHYDAVRVAVASSEAARQVVSAGRGTVEFALELPITLAQAQALTVTISGFPAQTGSLEIGRLVEQLKWQDGQDGRTLSFQKALPGRRLASDEVRGLKVAFGGLRTEETAAEELAAHNREVLEALEEANARRQDLQRINDELTETNRGVVALYDELDTLHRVGRVVASQIDLDSLLHAITEATVEISGAEMAAFLVRAPDADHYFCHTTRGEICHLLQEHSELHDRDLFIGLEQNEILRIDDLQEDGPRSAWPAPPLRSYLAVLVKDAEKRPVGALVFGHRQPRMFSERTERILSSVSVQVSIGMQNARLYQTVQAASAAKDQFLAMLSHELRTPLNPVFMLLASLDQRTDLADEVRHDLQVMRRNLQLEARLIDDMLDLTRIVRGKIALHFETVDVHSLLPVVRDVCQEQITTQHAELELRLESRKSWVVADSARLQQVFWNLLSNALKFGPNGKVIIRTSNPIPDILRVEVIDQGRGMRSETLKSIFHAFDQGESETNARYGGLGLGLAISKKVIDAHGGQIFAESKGLGQGARFVVEMRLAEETTKTVSHVPAAGAGDVKPGTGMRILLVEDHQDTLQTLQRLLTRRGYEVSAANTAQVASAMADNHRFDLVISDIGLPDRSGLDLMRDLQDRHGLQGIALSGYGMEADVDRSHQAGFIAHLTKPIDFAALEKAVTWAVSQTKPGA